ncbi:MvdC/MvdD family ATP grasp protein [Leisingera aquaemixtae]|uniref:MvdC/MvdD family ATP grasp protein n=1 Tax=Leisingera aquaemixtae TaxID=1396826 RepID=UPI0021A3F055|nr:hypothetical protein [Leisingera aquaemixtae]UWQ46864.1 hypothetical protein K3719_05735 [Leisingera aquaemixtae]
MKKFLIATAANDIHAIIVAQALKSLGVNAFRWVTSDFPSAQHCSVSYDNGVGLTIEGNDGVFSSNLLDGEFDFWNRRIIKEHYASEELCDADRVISASQSKIFINGILPFLDQSCRCINKIYAAERAECKPFQLMMAKRAGFTVPSTVISNDPSLIQHFLEHSAGRTLAKPFSPTVWKGEDKDYVTRSAIVRLDDLPADVLVEASPMIFQQYVEKSYEVRLTCFGDYPVAVKLNSQKTEASKVDWRAVSPANLGVERIEVPEVVRVACSNLLRSLDLSFGCIDLVVTPSGEWVFLEINQMGQFLWIEEVNPEIPMLDLFVQLLMGGEPSEGKGVGFGVRHAEFMSSASDELRVEQPLRAPKVGVNLVEDV